MRKPSWEFGIAKRALEKFKWFAIVAWFNVFPMAARSGVRESFSYAGESADRGYNLLVFPEGRRTLDGTLWPFRAGTGVLATRLGLPIVPMRIDGLFEFRKAGKKWTPPGAVRDETNRGVARMGQLEKAFTSVDTYYQSYGVVLAVLIAGVGLVAVAFGAARLIAPRRPVGDKLLTYECGIDPVGEGWSQSQVRYYVYGFLFVIFDVEAVFLFPWARIFEGLGWQAVVEMAIFIGILAIGLLYAWRKGVLKWA